MHSLKKHSLPALAVFCGSAAGGGLRFALQGGFLWLDQAQWLPILTILINLVAAIALGVVIAYTHQPMPLHERTTRVAMQRLFWGTGFCGGFSSFSLFTVDWLSLMQMPAWAVVYVFVSILAALAGFQWGRNRTRGPSRY